MPTTAIKREEKHSKKTGQHQPEPPRGGETPQSTQKPQSAKKQTPQSREEDEHHRAGKSHKPPKHKHLPQLLKQRLQPKPSRNPKAANKKTFATTPQPPKEKHPRAGRSHEGTKKTNTKSSNQHQRTIANQLRKRETQQRGHQH